MITQPLWPARMDTGRPPFSRGFSRLLVKVVAVATPRAGDPVCVCSGPPRPRARYVRVFCTKHRRPRRQGGQQPTPPHPHADGAYTRTHQFKLRCAAHCTDTVAPRRPRGWGYSLQTPSQLPQTDPLSSPGERSHLRAWAAFWRVKDLNMQINILHNKNIARNQTRR
jgi:hypothetical protein